MQIVLDHAVDSVLGLQVANLEEDWGQHHHFQTRT